MGEAERIIRDCGVVAIARSVPRGTLRAAAAAFPALGIRALEVTLESPGALADIAWLRERLGAECAVGAGTVRSLADLAKAREAGAEFVVSPHFDATLVRAAREAGLDALPGAFTPTEALAAWQAGASLVKLFPAGALGPGYLRALREPLPDVPFVPTGGVGPGNAEAFLRAGAVAVAVGGGLFGPREDGSPLGEGEDDVRLVLRRAEALVAAVRRGREEEGPRWP
ncbi:MAG: bifunctional 4-hydroxy-2-oxoglutarate aldolase/2-dehydro-3-deoxy-phosphogluconate aldolase [Clostridia bacterium]|nr:bifunctional 4-hydroxy-2-oxoglutarate aldolase/2-dehydro-3-deoxy-phosphogluconate aldolase [Clostridia bacterium]